MSGRWSIEQGDVLDALSAMPDASFDACLCDPPYAISFMAKSWDSFESPAAFQYWVQRWATELFRVLRPGAHALLFGGTRVFHRLTCGLEDAGFQVRDCLSWHYASGFPKSLAVDKAIDAANGDERPIVSETVGRWKYANNEKQDFCYGAESRETDERGYLIGRTTSAASAASAAWAGYGTALKPSWEPIVLVRKPLDGTVAHNALTHGVGGIHVDGCRIGHASAEDFAAHKAGVEGIKSRGGSMANSWKNSSDLSGANEVTALGRWPANTVLTHDERCRVTGVSVGSRPVIGNMPGRGTVRPFAGGGLIGSRAEVAEVAEVAEAYDCVDGCPVKMLNEQSGDRPGMSGGGVHSAAYGGGMFGAIDSASTARGDIGGAARFFFCAKASRFERDLGCGSLKRRSPGEMTNRKDGSSGLTNQRRGSAPMGVATNHHPTVKPIALARWLATMLLPPPRSDGAARRILVPFAGSGSEMVGALRAGWDEVVGIEREVEYIGIARERIARWLEMPSHVEPTASNAEADDARQVDLFGR